MSASIILNYSADKIQAAMAVALLKLKNEHGLSYSAIGAVLGREKQSVQKYICDDTEMPASCWIKAVAEWSDLHDRMTYELDEAEKDFRARQRTMKLEGGA